MSDGSGGAGVTLPNGQNATYNFALSPFFAGRSGALNAWVRGIWTYLADGRGYQNNFFFSDAMDEQEAHRLYADHVQIHPMSSYSKTQAMSLRCLVSTNNG